jgi:hypothetical protein
MLNQERRFYAVSNSNCRLVCSANIVMYLFEDFRRKARKRGFGKG